MNQAKQPATPSQTTGNASKRSGALPILSGMKDAQGESLRLDVPKEVLARLRKMR